MTPNPPATEAGPEVPVEVRPLRPDDWPLVEALFGARGACGGCWCMYWRTAGGKAWEAVKGEPNRVRLRASVAAGAERAVLALAGGRAVGWCSFGPKAEFPRLQRARTLRRPGDERAWAVLCFFVDKAWRRRGLAGRLLDAAAREAVRLGAPEVEGYPVRPSGPSAPPPFVWTGVPSLYEAAGFRRDPASTGAKDIYVRRAGEG